MVEDKGEGCGWKIGKNAAILALIFIVLSIVAAGCFCPEGSTWTATCYNFKGEYVGSASGNGCNCNCNSVMCGARVASCNVYSPQPSQIYPRPSLGR